MGKAMKDSALSVGLKAFFNDKFGEYGEVQDCTVDTSAGRVRAHVLMRGEREPITIVIERYEIEQEGSHVYFVIRELATSREWITKLLNRVLDGRRFEVPQSVRMVL
ncbi:MAG: hypothetical protein PHP86_06280 [Nevskiales bacterium]|nr:hypothetical protein [Nevskiales bacterium]